MNQRSSHPAILADIKAERVQRNLLAQHALSFAISKGILPPKRDIISALWRRSANVVVAKKQAMFRWTVMNPRRGPEVLQQAAHTFPSSACPGVPNGLHNGRPPISCEPIPSLLIRHPRGLESAPNGSTRGFTLPVNLASLAPPCNTGPIGGTTLSMSLDMSSEGSDFPSGSISGPRSTSSASSRSNATRPNKDRGGTCNTRSRRPSTSFEFMPVPAELIAVVDDTPQEQPRDSAGRRSTDSARMMLVLVDATPRGITTYETAPSVAPQLYVNDTPERNSDGLFVPQQKPSRKPGRGGSMEARRKRRGSVGDAYRAGEGKSGWIHREDGTSNMGLYASNPRGPNGKAARRYSVSRPALGNELANPVAMMTPVGLRAALVAVPNPLAVYPLKQPGGVLTPNPVAMMTPPTSSQKGPVRLSPLQIARKAHGSDRSVASTGFVCLSPILSPSLVPNDTVLYAGKFPYIL